MKQATLPHILKENGSEVSKSLLEETEEYVQPPIKTKYKIVTKELKDHYSLDLFLKVGNVNVETLEQKKETLENRIEANRSYIEGLKEREDIKHFLKEKKDLSKELEQKNPNGYSPKFNKKLDSGVKDFIEGVEYSYNQEKLREGLKDLFRTKKELKKLKERKEERGELYRKRIIKSPKRIKLKRICGEQDEEIGEAKGGPGIFKRFSKAYRTLKEKVLGRN